MIDRPDPQLVMLGPAEGTRNGVASVVEAYRAQGLFQRWPVRYIATHGEGGARSNAALMLSALRRFIGLLVHERSLVVHVHLAVQRGFWAEAVFLALALMARCPLVLHLHGAGFERLREASGPLGRRVMSLVLKHATCIVVPCESLRVWVGSITRGARVVCVPSPVAPAEPTPPGERPNVVLSMSKLDAANGALDLIEAVARVRAAVPDVRLVFAGHGERAALARHAERHGIADAVRFTGWVGPSGKRALLENAAVFALPAYEEALPVSLLEAMAAGVPVVASAVGGVPEAVADGVSGFLVAPGDVATLQRVLGTLLLNRTLAARIGATGQVSVRLRFAPQRSVAQLEAIYAAVGLCARTAEAAPLPDVAG